MNKTLKNVRRVISGSPALESVIYVLAGVLLAFVAYKSMGIGLGTSEPIVTVMSFSMLPTLDRGDLILLRGAPISELAEASKVGRQNGSIIVYYYPPQRRLIIHRLWKVNEDGTLTTWGDNVAQADPWPVRQEWVRGQMSARIPYLGWPRVLLSDATAALGVK